MKRKSYANTRPVIGPLCGCVTSLPNGTYGILCQRTMTSEGTTKQRKIAVTSCGIGQTTLPTLDIQLYCTGRIDFATTWYETNTSRRCLSSLLGLDRCRLAPDDTAVVKDA